MNILDDGLIIAGSENGGAVIMKTDFEGDIIWYADYLDWHPNNPHVPRFRAVIPGEPKVRSGIQNSDTSLDS